MDTKSPALISVVVPLFNETDTIDTFHTDLVTVLTALKDFDYEIIYVDDGSTDDSNAKLKQRAQDNHIKLLALTKNFGKEIAISAGLQQARGEAVIMVDADGQHPVKLIPAFIEKWQTSNVKVVAGIRTDNQGEGFVKRFGSKLFYALFNSFSTSKLVPGSTDFRLIDKQVVAKFCALSERNRIARGLIDWFGYKTAYIEFKSPPRAGGSSGYSIKKLIKLALTSFISLSFTPLYAMGYIGLLLTPLAVLTGIFMVIEDLVLNDPLHLKITGSGFLGILTVFLVGLVLVSQGLLALYISYIYEEVRNRPLFVIDNDHSVL